MFRSKLLGLIFFAFIFSFAIAQEKAKDKTGDIKGDFDKISEALNNPDQSSKEAMEKWIDEQKKRVADFRAKYAEQLTEGDGLYYSGRLRLFTSFVERNVDEAKKAIAEFRKFVSGNSKSDLAKDAWERMFQIAAGVDETRKLLKETVADYEKAVGAIEKSNEKLYPFKHLSQSPAGPEDLQGKVCPDLAVQSVVTGDMKSIKISDLKGKVVVIDFWATWCGPCRGVIPSLVKLYNEYKDKGLVVVGATRLYGAGWLKEKMKKDLSKEDEIALVKDFAKDFKITYPIVLYGEGVDMDFGVSGIPTIFVVDKEGKVAYGATGGGEENENALHEKVEELIKKD